MNLSAIMRSVYWNSIDGIVITDPETVITDVNPAYEELAGYSRAELIGRKTNIVKSGLTPQETFDDLWRQLETVGRWVGELVNRRKDGTLWHSYLSITRVDDPQGQVVAYVGIARDISQRKEMEERLRWNLDQIQEAQARAGATADRLRAILESVGEAIIMVDTQGTCVMANHLVGGVLGVATDRLIGMSIRELSAIGARVFRGTSALQWLPRPGGSPPTDAQTHLVETMGEPGRVFQEFSAPVEDESGGVIGRIYVYRDVTKEYEVDRMKNEFIATVSHELRTPMTSIKGSLGLVLGGIAGSLPEEAEELLSIAQNNTDRLIRLINDILDISRIEAGKMELRRGPVQIGESVERAVQALQGYADERKVQVTTCVEESIPRVMADADRLQQVLINLLSNAIKFSEPGKEVVVSSGRDKESVWVRVEDQGPGISKQQLNQIFEKFHRIENASTRKTGGTGLGLAICKAIVDEHGGHIWAESEVGKGSAFTFTLPLERDDADPTVLVVDDDPHRSRQIRLSLEQAGFRTLGASSGQEALEVASREHVDVVTLDLLMPDMQGLEVARRLKENPATQSTPLVLVSNANGGRHGAESRALGVSGVITKPIAEEELLQTVRQALGTSAEEGPTRPNVLVVDDDPDVRRMLSMMLGRAGYSVSTASDGQQAYRMILHQRPDLLILDLLMPNLDGFQLVRLLRRRKSTRETPLLVLSALDLTEGEKTFLTLGPTHHVTKGPEVQQEIVDRVRELLRPQGDLRKHKV